MNSTGINLFIVDDDPSVITGLRNYLEEKFGTYLNISTFNSGMRALEKVNKDTTVVLLDYDIKDEDENKVLKWIKEKNPKTEVIMFSSNEDASAAIHAFRNGATDYVLKGDKAERRIFPHLYRIIADPIRRMGHEYGLLKFLVIFLATFIAVGIISFTLINVIPD